MLSYHPLPGASLHGETILRRMKDSLGRTTTSRSFADSTSVSSSRQDLPVDTYDDTIRRVSERWQQSIGCASYPLRIKSSDQEK